MDDDLVRAYALEAQKALEEEANRRIAEQTDACLLYTSDAADDW